MELHFAKYEGAGNDFILIDARTENPGLSREQIARLCDRRFGIGADGLMTLENDPGGSDFYMRYYNADGGESTMCGNGGRCITLFAQHLGIGGALKSFHAIDGHHEAELLPTGTVRLKMIDVDTVEKQSPLSPVSDRAYYLFTGSPHYIEFTDQLADIPLTQHGPAVRYHERFAPIGGTNVNYVQITGPGKISIRTHERGVENETYACGTGVTAAALATHSFFQPEITDFTVEAIGGVLGVKFDITGKNSFRNIYLTGPAKRVFTGVITI